MECGYAVCGIFRRVARMLLSDRKSFWVHLRPLMKCRSGRFGLERYSNSAARELTSKPVSVSCELDLVDCPLVVSWVSDYRDHHCRSVFE